MLHGLELMSCRTCAPYSEDSEDFVCFLIRNRPCSSDSHWSVFIEDCAFNASSPTGYSMAKSQVFPSN